MVKGGYIRKSHCETAHCSSHGNPVRCIGSDTVNNVAEPRALN